MATATPPVRPSVRAAVRRAYEKQDPRASVPFACLRLVNPAMSITAGLGILRLSVAAGDVAVMDTREPSRTKYPVVLHAGPMRCGVLCTYTVYMEVEVLNGP